VTVRRGSIGLVSMIFILLLTSALNLTACWQNEPTKVIMLTAATPYTPAPEGQPSQPPEPTLAVNPSVIPTAAPTIILVADPAWVDQDGDSFPDEIEKQMGTDPFVNECLAEVGCGPAQTAKMKETHNIVLVMESTARMKENLEDRLLIDLVREGVLNYASNLPLGINLGIVTFGYEEPGCAAVENTYAVGPVDHAAFVFSLLEGTEGTGSPAGAALEEGYRSLVGQEGQTNQMILVTTSGDTCSVDLCELAKSLATQDQMLNVKIQTIGLDTKPEAREQLRCLSDATGGIYYEARSVVEFWLAWEVLLRQATEWARSMSCLAPVHSDFSRCMSQRLNAYMHWTQESGLMKENTDYAVNLMRQIQERITMERNLDLPPTSTP